MQLTDLPGPAMECFFNTVAEAVDLASRGEKDRGYNRLLRGLQQAEQFRSWGEPWADDLNRQYCLALARYANRYGLRPR